MRRDEERAEEDYFDSEHAAVQDGPLVPYGDDDAAAPDSAGDAADRVMSTLQGLKRRDADSDDDEDDELVMRLAKRKHHHDDDNPPAKSAKTPDRKLSLKLSSQSKQMATGSSEQ